MWSELPSNEKKMRISNFSHKSQEKNNLSFNIFFTSFLEFKKSNFWVSGCFAQYSKSQIFVQNPNIFTSFSPKFFGKFFSWNQSCQQLKSPKPQHFHVFFTPKNRQFSREIKVEFLDKKWKFRTVCYMWVAVAAIILSTTNCKLDGCQCSSSTLNLAF